MSNRTNRLGRIEIGEGETIEHANGQITGVFLSRKHLEKLVENYIPNPIVRTLARNFRKGASNLLTTHYDGTFSYQFNRDYVPTRREYEMARKQLELLEEQPFRMPTSSN